MIKFDKNGNVVNGTMSAEGKLSELVVEIYLTAFKIQKAKSHLENFSKATKAKMAKIYGFKSSVWILSKVDHFKQDQIEVINARKHAFSKYTAIEYNNNYRLLKA